MTEEYAIYRKLVAEGAESLGGHVVSRLEGAAPVHRAQLMGAFASLYEDLLTGKVLDIYMPDRGGSASTFAVDYRGPYSSFPVAINDFLKQASTTSAELARRTDIHSRKMHRIMGGKTTRIHSGDVDSILGCFDISPSSAGAELKKLAGRKE
jgi:hypothetical protein